MLRMIMGICGGICGAVGGMFMFQYLNCVRTRKNVEASIADAKQKLDHMYDGNNAKIVDLEIRRQAAEFKRMNNF